MRNWIFILLFACFNYSWSQTDMAYSYAPDSSALAILFKNIKLDTTISSFKLDLKNKWVYKKNDSLTVDIRGAFMALSDKEIANIEVSVFGKKQKIKLSEATTRLNFKRSVKNYKKNPTIQIKWVKKPKHSNVKIFMIDSFDIGTIRKNN